MFRLHLDTDDLMVDGRQNTLTVAVFMEKDLWPPRSIGALVYVLCRIPEALITRNDDPSRAHHGCSRDAFVGTVDEMLDHPQVGFVDLVRG